MNNNSHRRSTGAATPGLPSAELAGVRAVQAGANRLGAAALTPVQGPSHSEGRSPYSASGGALFRVPALVLFAAVLAGCASHEPRPTLLTVPASARPAQGASVSVITPVPRQPGAVLAVRRLGLPEYIQARRVRYRADASTLAEWPNTFWAERIEIGLAREFQAALRQALPGWQLCEDDCAERGASYAVQVDLAPLDFVRSRLALQAHARIVVSGLATGSKPAPAAAARPLLTLERNFELAASADTPQAHAQTLSDLLDALAFAVADTVQRAQQPGR